MCGAATRSPGTAKAPISSSLLPTHDRWHEDFYLKLNRNDGKGTCCNLMDCRPTQSRMVGDHYEVKVDGEWTPVPNDKINNVVAPDGGAHVCAPRQVGPNKGVLFCVVLPVPTANPKRLTETANRLILSPDERSLQVDLVRLDRTIRAAGCVGSRDPCPATPTQRAAAQISEAFGVRQR